MSWLFIQALTFTEYHDQNEKLIKRVVYSGPMLSVRQGSQLLPRQRPKHEGSYLRLRRTLMTRIVRVFILVFAVGLCRAATVQAQATTSAAPSPYYLAVDAGATLGHTSHKFIAPDAPLPCPA